jgi:hypothetical protein
MARESAARTQQSGQRATRIFQRLCDALESLTKRHRLRESHPLKREA